ncbi:MAG: 50S ribosomal protein L32e [Candidatus Thorarchaeota archaeon]
MSKKPKLSDVPGVGPAMEEKLRDAGIKTVVSLSKMDPKKLSEKVEGVGEASAKSFISEAKKLIPKDAAKPKEKAPGKPKKKAETKAKAEKAKLKKKVSEEKPKLKKKKAAAPKKKKVTPKKKPKVEVPLRVKNTDQRLLRIARQKKKRMPQFRHEQAHRWIRVSDNWRKVRGIDSATREKSKGRIAMVSSGYRTPKAVRDLHPSLYVEVRVHRPSEIENLDPEVHAVRIAATVGSRKKQEILAAADAKLLRVLNPGRSEEIGEEDLFTDLDLEVD